MNHRQLSEPLGEWDETARDAVKHRRWCGVSVLRSSGLATFGLSARGPCAV